MCDFPAAELLRMRRQVAISADASNDTTFVRNAMQFAKGVDDVRLAHEDLTGCQCWYEAVKKASA